MKKPPAFQFYAADFLLGTISMSAEAVGAYVRLLCHQWDAGFLENSDKILRKFSGASKKTLSEIKGKFTLCADGKLRNERLEAERVKQAHYREKQAEYGRKTHEGSLRVASGYPQGSLSSLSLSPSLSSNKDVGETKPKRAAAAAPASDSEWLDSLEANPAYQGIPIRREHAKMAEWCRVNGKQPSRRRFINWLNRAEQPMNMNRPTTKPKPPIPEPARWREQLRERFPTAAMLNPASPLYVDSWDAASPHMREEIVRMIR